MKVTATRQVGGHKNGETFEIDASSGQWLVDRGYATKAKSSPKVTTEDDADDAKPARRTSNARTKKAADQQ